MTSCRKNFINKDNIDNDQEKVVNQPKTIEEYYE